MAKNTLMTFDQAGGMQVDQTGFTGKACAEMTADLIKGIGAAPKKETKKPEFNMVNRNTTGNKLTTGR